MCCAELCGSSTSTIALNTRELRGHLLEGLTRVSRGLERIAQTGHKPFPIP